MAQFHVLNGDAIVELLQLAGIQGKFVVWREMLAEGPSVGIPGTAEFNDMRKTFFQQAYGVSAEDYEQKCVEEWQPLLPLQDCEELVLWFEYDLFCQLNLLGVLALLEAQPQPLPKVSIAYSGQWEGHARLRGIGELEVPEAGLIYEQRKTLKAEDITAAAQLWDLYVQGAPTAMLAKAGEMDTERFPYLYPALEAHLRRFPNPITGINEIEQAMLAAIEEGKATDRTLVGYMLRRENYYGFGDLQYFHYLEQIKPLLVAGDALALNELGEQVLQGKQSYRTHALSNYQYGGANHWDFHWDGKQLKNA